MVDQALLVLRIGVLVLLYVFVWRIARTAIRDVRGAQESMIIRPGQGFEHLPLADEQRAPVATEPVPPGRLLVVESDVLPAGAAVLLEEHEVLIGRDPHAAAMLEGDGFVSARHALVRVRGTSTSVVDLGSTNGTFVNGERIAIETRLSPGDEVAVGSTRMIFEPGS
ncbi:MAG: FHA domain-containing protein [Actinobacteria bacterium]|nr:FHA domain-containing protein [Actinomycetota bacterium]